MQRVALVIHGPLHYPGAWSGTAGFIVGTNLDTTVGSRLAPTVGGRNLRCNIQVRLELIGVILVMQQLLLTCLVLLSRLQQMLKRIQQDIQSRLPAALVSGRIDASVGATKLDWLHYNQPS